MGELKCTGCGSVDLEPGFLLESGNHGFGEWVAGVLERGGIFNMARVRGRQRRKIDAFRCRGCGRLQLYAMQIM